MVKINIIVLLSCGLFYFFPYKQCTFICQTCYKTKYESNNGIVSNKINRGYLTNIMLVMKLRKIKISWYKQEQLIDYFISGSTARYAGELIGIHRNTLFSPCGFKSQKSITNTRL